MSTFVERNFRVRGVINSILSPPSGIIVDTISGIEVQLWHESPMYSVFLGKGITDNSGIFIIDIQIDSPTSYITDGKIKDVFIKCFYNGQDLDLNNGANLKRGLIAYWKLDGNSNDAFENYNGTDVSVTYSYANGKINQGAGFNGSSSGITTIGSSETFSFIQNTCIFTISFWMKPTDYTAYKYLMGNTGTSSQKGFFVTHMSDGAIRIAIFNGTGVTAVNSSSSTSFMTDNDWHHIAIVVDRIANTVTFYKDAVAFAGSGSIGTLSTGDSTNTLALGRISSTSDYFPGALDEVGFWNRALAEAEIIQLYNNGNGRQFPFTLD